MSGSKVRHPATCCYVFGFEGELVYARNESGVCKVHGFPKLPEYYLDTQSHSNNGETLSGDRLVITLNVPSQASMLSLPA